MPFIFPGLLWLGLAAGVPVIIHILNKRRYKKVTWGAMTFLLRALREETKRIQYKDILLMLLRALVCIFLAMMIARPITRFFSSGESENKYVILIFDNSASMNCASGTETLFDKAKREAVSLVREIKSNSCIGIIEASAPAGAAVLKTMDIREAEDILTEIQPTDCGNDFEGALNKAREIFDSEARAYRREILVVTDLPARVWGDKSDALNSLLTGIEDVHAYIIPVTRGEQRNLGITSIETYPALTTVERPLSATVTVANGGNFTENSISVEMFLDDSRISAQSVENLEPGESSELKFLIAFEEPGIYRLKAVVNGGREKYSADDTRQTVVEVIQGKQVLLVDGDPGTDFGESETDYVEASINPFFKGKKADSYIITKVKGHEFTPEAVHGMDIVVIANIQRIEETAAETLKKFVSGGGGLLIFLGANSVPERYNSLFERKGASIMPARIGNIVPEDAGGDDPEGIYLSQDYLEHTCMNFFDRRETVGLLRVPVMKAFALDTKGVEGANVVARYENGVTAVAERKIGRGKVMLTGTTADNEWNYLFTEPLGPILTRRFITYLISNTAVRRQGTAGSRISLPLPPEERKADLSLITPGGKILTINPETVDERPFLIYEEKGRTGMYTFKIELDTVRKEYFALNTPEEESFVKPLQPREFAKIYTSDSIELLSEGRGKSAGSVFKESKVGRELWWPVLLLGFFIFVGEITFARLITTDLPSTDDMPAAARASHRRHSSLPGDTDGSKT